MAPQHVESNKRGRIVTKVEKGWPVREEENGESLVSLRRHFMEKEEVLILSGKPSKRTDKWHLILARWRLLLTLTRPVQ